MSRCRQLRSSVRPMVTFCDNCVSAPTERQHDFGAGFVPSVPRAPFEIVVISSVSKQDRRRQTSQIVASLENSPAVVEKYVQWSCPNNCWISKCRRPRSSSSSTCPAHLNAWAKSPVETGCRGGSLRRSGKILNPGHLTASPIFNLMAKQLRPDAGASSSRSRKTAPGEGFAPGVEEETE
jgi:hypothetical protein